jgi:V-type H+-transporting ATPase subunit D
MSGTREAIFPTRMALTNTKLRLKGAQTGHSLLAKKRDALMTRFRAILRKVDEVGGIYSTILSAKSLFRYLSLYNARVAHRPLSFRLELRPQAKRKMGRVMQLASFSMAEVTYATGDISYLVQEQAKTASFRVKASQENVSGVVLPTFEVDRVGASGASGQR